MVRRLFYYCGIFVIVETCVWLLHRLKGEFVKISAKAILVAGIVVTAMAFNSFAQEEKKAVKTEQKAVAGADAWLALMDAGEYGKAWEEAAEYLKRAVTREQWERSNNAFRKPLGKVVERKLRSIKLESSLPGAPDGEYVVIRYDTVFENKKKAVETVTPMLEKDGKWKVSGHFIK